jgi:hypothetical protein
MKSQTLVVALTIVNLVVLVLNATHVRSAPNEVVVPMLRGRALELVDDRGLVRSRMEIKPGGSVVLQLFDQKGVIKVKLDAGEDGSGLFLADETTQSGVQIIARQAGTTDRPQTTGITMTGKAAAPRVIAP